MSDLQAQCEQVRKEALEAYFDCHGLKDAPEIKLGELMPEVWQQAFKRRKLDWRAKFPVPVIEAAGIMREALADTGDYNEFKPSFLELVYPLTPVVLAREHSVCMYFLASCETVTFGWDRDRILPNGTATRKLLKCDEYHVMPDGSLRLWWD